MNLPSIAEHRRRAEAEFWADFDEARPAILGGLLDALVAVISNLPSTTLAELPRMADFALVATAAEPGLGLGSGDFMAAYRGNRADANTLAIEGSVVAKHLIDLAAKRPLARYRDGPFGRTG